MYDWSRFDVFLHLRSPAEAVFRAWATSGGLESFFMGRAQNRRGQSVLAADELVQPGDGYEWTFLHGAQLSGRITEVIPGERVGFTFGDCLASVTLAEREGVTRVHLEQWNIPLTEEGRVEVHLSCRGAWIYFCSALKARLELGVELRDRDPATAGSLAISFKPID